MNEVNISGSIEGSITFEDKSFKQVPTVGDLKSINTDCLPDNTVGFVAGYHSAGDGGHGMYRWNKNNFFDFVDDGAFVAPNSDPSGKSGAWEALWENNQVSVRRFGARGDGTSNDAPAFQSMFDYMPITMLEAQNKPTHMIVPHGKYLIGSTLQLPANKSSNGERLAFTIEGLGRPYLQATVGVPMSIFQRIPQNMVESTALLEQTFKISGLEFSGDYTTPEQKGIEIASTYSMRISNCYFRRLGFGIDAIFALNCLIEQCHATQCLVTGFRYTHGSDSFDPGRASQSNQSEFYKCRVFGAPNSERHFWIKGSNNIKVTQCTCEGKGGKELIVWERGGSTTVKQFEMTGTHFEADAQEALLVLDNPQGGRIVINGLRHQQSGNCVMAVKNIVSPGMIVCNDWVTFPSGSYMKASGTGTILFNNPEFNALDEFVWENNTLPNITRIVYKNGALTTTSNFISGLVTTGTGSNTIRLESNRNIIIDTPTNQRGVIINGGWEFSKIRLLESPAIIPGLIPDGGHYYTEIDFNSVIYDPFRFSIMSVELEPFIKGINCIANRGDRLGTFGLLILNNSGADVTIDEEVKAIFTVMEGARNEV
jgi:hypothetical protein